MAYSLIVLLNESQVNAYSFRYCCNLALWVQKSFFLSACMCVCLHKTEQERESINELAVVICLIVIVSG